MLTNQTAILLLHSFSLQSWNSKKKHQTIQWQEKLRAVERLDQRYKTVPRHHAEHWYVVVSRSLRHCPFNTIPNFSRLTRRVMFPTRRRRTMMRKLTNPLVGREDSLQTVIKIKAAPRTKKQQTSQPRDDHADCPMLVLTEIHQPRMLLLLQLLLPVKPGRKHPTMNHAEHLHEVQRDRDL